MEQEQAIRFFSERGQQISKNYSNKRGVRRQAWQNLRKTDQAKSAWDALASLRQARGGTSSPLNPPEFTVTAKVLELQSGLASEGEAIRDALYRLNWIEQRDLSEIASLVEGWNRRKVAYYLNKSGLEPRPTMSPTNLAKTSALLRSYWANPLSRESLVQALLRHWSDPDKKAQRLAKTQTPAARSKRAEAQRRVNQTNPELRQSRIAALQRGREAYQTTSRARLKERLGGDPKVALDRMFNQQHLTTEQVATQTGYTPSYLRYLITKLGITIIPASHRRLYHSPSVQLVRDAIDRGIFSQLNSRAQTVLLARTGLGRNSQTLAELSESLGVSIERVRQIEGAALRRLNKLTG